MHYSSKVSGGSQIGPSLSVQMCMLGRLNRILGLARRGGRVNAILDKYLMLSEIAVMGPDNESYACIPTPICRDMCHRICFVDEDEISSSCRSVKGACWSFISKTALTGTSGACLGLSARVI